MTIQRMDHVGVVVDDLASAKAFFVELGLKLQGEGTVEGGWVDRVVGLEGVRVEYANEVVRGSGRMKVDEEIVELKEWDAVRVPPGTWRGYEAGPQGLEILVIGAPSLGEAPREDVDGQRDWWAD